MGQQILVTGATGFIGRALRLNLLRAGYEVRGTIRNPSKTPLQERSHPGGLNWVVLHDQSTAAELQQVLKGVHVVIHLAARVHVMAGHESDRRHEFTRINADWTERLARAAGAQGVRRFVYMSSIKVHGEKSSAPFTEEDSPSPQDPYGVSKWEAERGLAMVSSQTSLEIVVIRSPLVYGPGVGGNFLQLLKIVQKGIPLPFALVENRRSLIYQGNLVDALIRSVEDDRAAGRTYLVSDGEDLSTPDLIRRLGAALGLRARLWPLPIPILRRLGQVVGKQMVVERLVESLQVNPSKIRQELDWHPPFCVDQGLAETAGWFRAHAAKRVMVA